MSVLGHLLLSGQDGYTISRSVRLRSSASAYFNRTLTTPTGTTKWTWSGWVKRGTLGASQTLFSGSSDVNNWGYFGFLSGDTLTFSQADAGSVTSTVTTTQVFRDPSAWYHIVVVFDSTQATAANRLLMYINGVQITSFGTATYLAQNTASRINTANPHQLGRYFSAANYLDGYLTEVNFIDGQALTPSSFGENDTVTGVWKPKKYAGTYGTNGFYLNFSDNSNNTAATIGKDYSGNGNNWTPNNISVTSGTTYDSMLDVPTPYADGGNGRGNYAVMNPLDYVAAAFSGTASDGNLTVSIPAPGSSNGIASSIKVFSTAQTKFYIETTVTALTTFCSLGMISGTNANYRIRHTNDITINVNDVIMTAFDPATGNVWYGRNGTWLSSGNPSAGTNPWATMSAGEIVGSAFSVVATNGSTGTFTTNTNFGQRSFAFTPPTGFKALNTQNLPEPTIKKGGSYFNTMLYTGNAGSQSITGVGFQPDLVWGKLRSTSGYHRLHDVLRGADNTLSTNVTDAEVSGNGLVSFDADGFTMDSGTNINQAYTYVAWNWKESVSAGFDIVTYTGTGANRTIAHSLGVAPSMIIIKCRDSATDPSWIVGHTGIVMGTGRLILNGTDANSNAGASSLWNSTAANSSVFSLGTYSSVNQNTLRFVAYLFSEVAGYSKFGSYTGNGSTDGTFVYCGFRPRFIMIKRTDTTSNWVMWDTTRDTYNASGLGLYPNLSAAEDDYRSSNPDDILSNGFKLRANYANVNASGGTYIFMAVAENPFKLSLAR